MPFTPFHMGAGIAFKALLRGGFSLMVFGWANVVVDLQPLFAYAFDRDDHHGWSHTFVGAIVLGAVAGVSGKYLAQWALSLFHKVLRTGKTQAAWTISWRVTWVSVYLGTISHVVLDMLTHGDMYVYWPFSAVQPWLGVITLSELSTLLTYVGLVGAAVYYGTNAWLAVRKKRAAH